MWLRRGRWILLFVVFLWWPQVVLAAAPDNWQWVKHTTGMSATTTVCSFVQDTTNTNILYAYTLSNGLYKTIDGGANWTTINTGLPLLKSSRWCFGNGEIAIDPNNNQIIYSVIDGQVYKTINGGTNWSFSSTGTSVTSTDGTVTDELLAGIIIDPTNSNHLYAGTVASGFSGGVFESENAGATWVQIEGFSPSGMIGGVGFNDAWPLVIDPSDTTRLYYFSFHDENASSSDAGVSWKKIEFPNSSDDCEGAEVAIHPTNHTILLATNCGLFKSTDYGTNWSETTSFLNKSVRSVTFSQSNPAIIYVLVDGHDIYKSIDSGDNWTLIKSDSSYILKRLRVDQTNPALIFVSSGDNGMYKSTDSGATLTVIKTGMSVSFSARKFYQNRENPQLAYMYASSKLYETTDAGYTWSQLAIGSVSPYSFNALNAVDPVSGTMYASSVLTSVSPFQARLLRSTDKGANWTIINTYSGDYAYDVIFSAKDHNTALSYDGGGHVIKTVDGGLTWTPITFFEGKGFYGGDSFVFDPNNSAIIYGGSGDDYPYKSIDGGVNWSKLSSGITDASIVSVAVSPYDSNLVFVGSGNQERYFRSADGGATFSMVLDLHPYSDSWPYAVQFDVSNPNIMYAGGTSYSYKSVDAGLTWALIDTTGLNCSKTSIIRTNLVATGMLYARNGCDNQPYFYENNIPKFETSTFTVANHDGASQVFPNNILDFTFNLKNTGPATGNSPDVKFVLPTGISYITGSTKVDGSTITYNPLSGNTLTISTANIDYGTTIPVTFQASVDSGSYGEYQVNPLVTSAEDVSGTQISNIHLNVETIHSFGISSPQVCNEYVTPSIPNLFEIRTSSSSADLFFVPSTAPYSYFYISYSTRPDAMEHGVDFDQSVTGGVVKYTISMLKPNTKYYFKVRPGNGCATGNWGNIMAAITTGKVEDKRVFYKDVPSFVIVDPLISIISKSEVTPNPTISVAPIVSQPVLSIITQSQSQSQQRKKFCILWWCF